MGGIPSLPGCSRWGKGCYRVTSTEDFGFNPLEGNLKPITKLYSMEPYEPLNQMGELQALDSSTNLPEQPHCGLIYIKIFCWILKVIQLLL